ncbi:bifunctional methylenetetrahydrofolate dehydrogenase/methenyltetrahydrofolate cyclohydrolase FolD [Desulfuromonas thiophila]|uniref:Bifunctional protein FolD n=1 Tax=Desulfuromonas thiophila TaxID=57664 RepID=A0A1G7BHK9_9BACT|nr:bifunctional methylenetetrahydrofolate dehydrogenase/methenyltetrahydrofolate cyclohydrolase FolD [Desulfuromonas thiophila]MDY0251482.1 bifunctional methylenetetrahydrofolate dehydrogenase/methenyltetrahydrofolate cyclohydrolase FolD [Pseudomonas sp.]SDE26220.1 methenyltetrahydrofolate cyclohydrolase [Desulfuromonas thiophila]
MAATLIDGKALAARLRQQLTTEVEELRQRGVVPGLAVVLVGDDPASRVYVSMKEKACAQVGIFSAEHRLPAETSQQQLLELIGQLNQDRRIDGILVQLPLPGHIDENAIIAAIDPAKDVDGFHPVSVGRLAIGQPGFRSCTPFGVMKMLEDIGCDLNGKEVVVVGRSNIVGKPVALMCLAQNATVTLCHSRTRDLAAHVGRADVVIAAVGRPEMIQGDWIKPGAVVIDVGINRLADGRLVGDVAFEAAAARASAITPVPGGVGPMTITMLLYNTVESARQRP